MKNKNQHESKIIQSQKGLVSIIIPVYNGEHHLDELIENLVNQTYKKIEIITVDNNSTDNSLELLKILSKEKTFLRILEKVELYNHICADFFLKILKFLLYLKFS